MTTNNTVSNVLSFVYPLTVNHLAVARIFGDRYDDPMPTYVVVTFDGIDQYACHYETFKLVDGKFEILDRSYGFYTNSHTEVMSKFASRVSLQ